LSRPTILFLVTEDWYFWSHRSDLARAALAAGFSVALAARFTAHRERIEALGILCIEVPFVRAMQRPWFELRLMIVIASTVARLAPTIVHAVALKPILLSTLAVARCPRSQFCHAVTGLGYLFISRKRSVRALRAVVRPLLRWLFSRKHSWLIVQNEDDLSVLSQSALGEPVRTVLIPGAGVDTRRFAATPLPTGVAWVILPSRMLRDKGVYEFVAAARRVHQQGVSARFALVGGTDEHNPAGLKRDELEVLCADGAVEWWEHQEDMPAVYARASIVCLPSYREGLPKVLLEAAACGRPLIATDVPGCREVCRHGETGLLVPAQDADALAGAMRVLLSDPELGARYGRNGRVLVERRFSSDVINFETLAFYRRIQAAPGAGNTPASTP